MFQKGATSSVTACRIQAPADTCKNQSEAAPEKMHPTFVLPSKARNAILIKNPFSANGTMDSDHKSSDNLIDLASAKQSPRPVIGVDVALTTNASSIPAAEEAPHSQAQMTTSRVTSSEALRAPKAPQVRPHPPNKDIARPAPQLDIHAPTYIPLSFLAVNDSNAITKQCCPLDSISYDNYISDFAGKKFLSPIPYQPPPQIRSVPFIYAAPESALPRNNYFNYFFECLQNEINANVQDLSRLRMYNIPFVQSNMAPHCFAFTIPGLREHSPSIDIGDVVSFRQILAIPVAQQAAAVWYAPGGGRERGICFPCFSGEEYTAIVWAVSRSKEQIILRIDGLNFAPVSARTGNLLFTVQEHRYIPLWRAVATVSEELQAHPRSLVTSDWIGRMLFPCAKDAVLQTRLSPGVFQFDWYDTELNYEQQKAVDAIVANQYGNVPYLISGPPGTGKTKTLVETVLQLLKNPPDALTPHLLVCAPSDPAADTLTLRLSKHLSQSELFRLNSWTRASAEVPGEILGYTFMENDLFSLPVFPVLMQYKVIVTTCAAADMLVQARLTNKDLAKLALETMFAISPSAILDMKPLHWTALLIDEAAQATEPDALIPLSVVSTTLSPNPAQDIPNFEPQFIMAGDEHQLGPRLFLNSSHLARSLFARLFARPFYAEHPLSRNYGSKPFTRALLPLPRPAFMNLIRNYRSHPAILATSSLLFYSDTLLSESNYRTALTTQFPRWKGPYKWPVLFIQSSSPDAFEDIASSAQGITGTSLFNLGEVEVAVKITKELLHLKDAIDNTGTRPARNVLQQGEIAVISPFRSQVNHLRNHFRKEGYRDVNIGPLEAFQGLESRVVILCTTRTRLGAVGEQARFVKEDIAWNRGVIGQKQKFNVAMTRAQEALFVIGDERALTCSGDECWMHFLSFAGRNKAVEFEGPIEEARFKEQMGRWPSRVGRLEAGLRFGVEIGDEKGRRVNISQDEIEGDDSSSAANGGTDSRSSRKASPMITSNMHSLRGLRLSDDDRMLSEGIEAEAEIRAFQFQYPRSDASSRAPSRVPTADHKQTGAISPVLRPPPGLSLPTKPTEWSVFQAGPSIPATTPANQAFAFNRPRSHRTDASSDDPDAVQNTDKDAVQQMRQNADCATQ